MLHPANIRRSNRKTLSLFIDADGELIVKAPLRLSNEIIFEFIKSKESWIKTQQAKVVQSNAINKAVLSYNSFMYLGRELSPYITTEVKKITWQGDNLLIPSKIAEKGDDEVIKKVKLWLKKQAKEIIEERIVYFSRRLNLKHSSSKIMNNKTRWGTCSKGGEIALNWRAIMIEPKLLDYIVIHEFCHLLEFNHSRAFWALVEAVLPNWRDLRKQLKQLNWIIALFRD